MRCFLFVLAIINTIVFFKVPSSYIKTILPLFTVTLVTLYGFKFEDKNIKNWFKNNIKIICYMIIYFYIFLPQIFKFEIWSEEHGWINIAIDVLQGTRKEILTAKSDYPSSFQSWPLALVMYFVKTPVVSSRLTGLLYLVSSFYFISGIGAIFLKIDKKPIIPALLFSLSTTPLIYVFTGWHEITYIPLLIFGMFYHLFNFIYNKKKSSLIFYAVFSGISMWSLYMPCFVAVAFSILFLIYPKFREINFKDRINYIIYLSPIVSPFIAIILKYPILNRHKFLLFNKNAQEVAMQNDRLGAWFYSLKVLFYNTIHIDKWSNVVANHEKWAHISLGPICTLLLIFIICYLIIKRSFFVFYFMILPFVVLVSVLMFSNPNFWREHFLYELLIIMSVYGFCVIYNWLRSKNNGKIFAKIFVTFVVVIHSVYFTNRYLQILSFWPSKHLRCYQDAINGIAIANSIRPYINGDLNYKGCQVFYPPRLDFIYAKATLGVIGRDILFAGKNSDPNFVKISCENNENISLNVNEILANNNNNQ